ncbi:hypothetical protein AKO1_011927, partial [Acrasis kona]
FNTTPSSKSVWNPEEKYKLNGKVDDGLLICYKTDATSALKNKHKIQHIMLVINNKLNKIPFDNPQKMQPSKYAADGANVRYLVKIDREVVRNKNPSHIKIKFDDSNLISEVLVLRYEVRLLEMAMIQKITLGVKENLAPTIKREVTNFLNPKLLKSPHSNVVTPKKSSLKQNSATNL